MPKGADEDGRGSDAKDRLQSTNGRTGEVGGGAGRVERAQSEVELEVDDELDEEPSELEDDELDDDDADDESELDVVADDDPLDDDPADEPWSFL